MLLVYFRSIQVAWIGFTDHGHEGSWKWIDTSVYSSYTNWHMQSSEPNGGYNENCAWMVVGWNGTWNDVQCAANASFICQKRVGRLCNIHSPLLLSLEFPAIP